MASAFAVHPAQVPDWNNLSVLHRGTLPPRAYFYVHTSEENALTYDVNKSKSHCLSGTWKFRHSNSPFEAPEGFESPSFDTSSWGDIAVPGMWQLQGFGKGPQYTNVQFPIPVDPPNVPFTENETGSYVRLFTIPPGLRGSQVRLRFEGVDSAFHVWVNGKEVGYSQGSRNPDEFDITRLVDEEGENTLAVRVYQFCDGTYIEDQDQWWLSGIFRDVFLIGFPKDSRIEDLHVQTILDANYINAELKLKVSVSGSGNFRAKLLGPSKECVASLSTEFSHEPTLELSTLVQNPLKWTAESPNLYHLVVSVNSEQYVSHRIGFRQVEMKDGLIKVNGQRIVFRGVNRHEHHPQFGRAVPLEFLKQDLSTMKRHNINAIRTSHQPSDPRLYHLADEMGFWIIDEADLECHGFELIADASLSPQDRALPFRQRQLLTRKEAAKWTTDSPDWTHAYVDRAEQLVKRDQLHPSIIIWSLGNEAFFGGNFKAMYEWIKEFDNSRPIHYEADIDAETMDMFSRMYPPIDEIVKFGEDNSKEKPLVLCEFVHAMGNGPGNIKEYIDAFYKYPKLQGGFAWEWANHGLLARDKTTGNPFYAYGGDFRDEPNDSTFVMDGLVNSDHTPNPGLTEYKKAIEPVQVIKSSSTNAKIVNRYDFITLDHLECLWSVTSESQRNDSGSIPIPSGIGPGETADLDLPDLSNVGGEVLLSLSFRLRSATPYLESGFEIGSAQIPVTTSPAALQTLTLSRSDANLDISTPAQNTLEIKALKSTWTFSTLHGTLTSWAKGGASLITKAPELSFYRAPTDNDIPQDGWDWKDKLLPLAKVSTRKVKWGYSGSEFVITVTQRVAPPVLSWSIDCILTYRFHPNGSLSIHTAGIPKGQNLPRTLPHIGLVLEMSKELQQVEWFGRGPGESYRDSKLSQPIATYSVSRIDDLWTDYEVPQESSNRTDTRWLKLSNSSFPDTGLFVQFRDNEKEGQSRALFDFQVSHYRMADVAEAKHPFELRRLKREEVVLRLNWQHHGLGSGSCGPRTLDQYSLLTAPFEFEILLQ
ncbi:glycoside hydrolase family 2 protein [Zopfia rhizophila CBS 207.26]|uniref:beta-galactosidase n=1 Tax=Zopfia rhizophila CBS 207.26 TaxID=1314779 RepID=A0A6A6DDM8_9PEZI|nr:glycoside hydrolase family 2 protein [Zopfia rhizophila CBS 207.26]